MLKAKTGFLAISLLFLLLAFQNCSIKKGNSLDLDTSDLSSSSANNGSSSAGGGSAVTPAPLSGNTIEAQAITLLQNKCYACHGTVSSGGISKINDPDSLIAAGQLVAGNPDGSAIYLAAQAGRMPIGSSVLTASELDILRQWILAGAQKPSSSSQVPAPVQLPLMATYASIQSHIITPKCVYCHSASNAKDGVRLDSYAAVKKYISTTSPTRSKIYVVTSSGEMPPRPDTAVTAEELKVLNDWIKAGALEN